MDTIEEIKQHLEYGDWRKVGKMVGVSRKYAIKIASRPTSKLYSQVFDAAKKIAQANAGLGI
ncbi:hypothetical protein WBJ53_08650 [Spirosoma sp. SC4-14]|uniref:hypothetical protein n=1 Tax=Spirosoma sp. SC4-14 TaxID=3128900 RepID=UPI0030CFFD3F